MIAHVRLVCSGYYAAIPISRVKGVARPFVRSSVCRSVCLYTSYLLNLKVNIGWWKCCEWMDALYFGHRKIASFICVTHIDQLINLINRICWWRIAKVFLMQCFLF